MHNFSMASDPLFSIVMPSFQQGGFLEEAVRSVLNQQGVNVELLVMDPGSTDGSRELLLALKQEYGDRLNLYFDSDSGQSDAVNRGMALAAGNILGWLNSDDRLRPGALAKVINRLNSSQPRWLYGRAGMIDKEGNAHLWGIVGEQKEVAFASKRVILTAEEIVDEEAPKERDVEYA